MRMIKKVIHRLFLGVLVTLVMSQSAFAIDESFYSANNILYYDPTAGLCSASNTSSSSALVGNDNLEKIYNYMLGKGLKDYQAAGVVGNIAIESGGDPLIVQGGGTSSDPSTVSAGWGLLQWTPGSKIVGLAKQAGITTAITELSAQLDLTWWHMNNTTPLGKTGFMNEFNATTDVSSATSLFMTDMEGPLGSSSLSARINAAKTALTYKQSSSSATTAPDQNAFIDKYYSIAQKFNVEYGIPWEAVMAQGILESASGTSQYATERNNFFGIGAFDSNPDNATSYPTAEDGWRGYYENIVNTSTYREHGAFNYPGDPKGYIQAIKDAGYASDSNYVTKVDAIIDMVSNYAKTKGYQSSADIVASNPDAGANAKKYAAGATAPTSSSSTTSSSTDSCASTATTSSGVSGDAKTIQDEFAATGGTYGAYTVASNGCTTLPAWYINTHTDLKYGDGNGGEVVANLVAKNGGTAATEPTGIAIYSVTPGHKAWGAAGNDAYGHTGIVVSIDSSTKTATVLQTWSGIENTTGGAISLISTYTYPTDGVVFYNLTGHTK